MTLNKGANMVDELERIAGEYKYKNHTIRKESYQGGVDRPYPGGMWAVWSGSKSRRLLIDYKPSLEEAIKLVDDRVGK